MGIKNKQNDTNILKLQYSARHAYNLAESFEWFSWVLTIVIILIGWFDNGSCSNGVAYAVAIITVINAIIDYLKSQIIKLAAGTRTYIDYMLFDAFGNSFKKAYNGFTVDFINKFSDLISKIHRKTYQKQISHTGTDDYKGVRDWYTLNDKMTTEEEVISAQKENCGFDKCISNFSWKFAFIIFVIFAFCIFKFDKKFLLICVFIPVFLKMIKSYFDYCEYKKVHDEERIIISKLDDYGYDKSLSLQLQQCIDERRQLDFQALSFIYKITSLSLHSKNNQN